MLGTIICAIIIIKIIKVYGIKNYKKTCALFLTFSAPVCRHQLKITKMIQKNLLVLLFITKCLLNQLKTYLIYWFLNRRLSQYQYSRPFHIQCRHLSAMSKISSSAAKPSSFWARAHSSACASLP